MKKVVDTFLNGRSCVIDGHNTMDEWGLVLVGFDPGIPKPKTVQVSVQGYDGAIDLTEAVAGGVTYENRKAKLKFARDFDSYDDAVRMGNTIKAALHGITCRIYAPDFFGGYLVGRVSVKSEVYHLHALTVSIDADCDPFLYESDGAATLASSPPVSLNGRRVDGLPDDFSEGCAEISLSIRDYANVSWNDVSTSGFMVTASGKNLLDVSRHASYLLARKAGESAFSRSDNMHQSGQRFYTGEMATNWVHRIMVNENALRAWGTAVGGFKRPEFPLLGGTLHLTAFLTGKATEVSNAKVTLFAESYTGTWSGVQGGAGYSSTTELSASLNVVANKSYADEPIRLTIADTYSLNGLRLEFSGIKSEGFGVTFMLSVEKPNEWEEADIEFQRFFFGSTVQSSKDAADTVRITPWGTEITKNTVQTSDPRVAKKSATRKVQGTRIPWPSHKAKHVGFCMAGTDGELCIFNASVRVYPLKTSNVVNAAMPATPKVTSQSPTVFISDGHTVMTDAGSEQLLPVTLYRGQNELRYSIVGSGNAVLTWPKGRI